MAVETSDTINSKTIIHRKSLNISDVRADSRSVRSIVRPGPL